LPSYAPCPLNAYYDTQSNLCPLTKFFARKLKNTSFKLECYDENEMHFFDFKIQWIAFGTQKNANPVDFKIHWILKIQWILKSSGFFKKSSERTLNH
jgi:hypothetical protein